MSMTSQSKFPRGSEWRRWDLHVHTPASVLNNQFGNNWDQYIHRLFTRAIENGIAAIGITDYFSIDGYRKIKQEYLADRNRLEFIFNEELKRDSGYIDKILSILVIPNIELRLSKYVAYVKRRENNEKGSKKNDLEIQEKRATIHVLLSDEISIQDIEENFLQKLEITYIGIPQGPDEKLPLTRSNLEKLGRRLQMEHTAFHERHSSDFYTGAMQAGVDDGKISDVLNGTPSIFKSKYVIALAEEYVSDANWDGAGHQARKLLCQRSDMLFSANPRTVKWAASEEVAKEFGSAKPCIWGSDAHSYDKLFEPDDARYCWIKADTTFSGLRQLLNEPAERCYIGECPPALRAIREAKKPHIVKLSFFKNPDSTLSEKWFDSLSLEFNSGMVTIIGNKGGGKSALADTLALLGNSKVNPKHFSFLRAERFKRRDAGLRRNRSEDFAANAVWSTSEEFERQLACSSSQDELERVRYLPQGYLEKLCNEHEEEAQKEFRNELDRVIFSHVEPPLRLGKATLEELIDYRTDEIIRTTSSLKRHLRDINHKIVVLEQKSTEAIAIFLDEKVKAKELELSIHEASRPVEVRDPRADQSMSAESTEVIKKIDALKDSVKDLLERQAEHERELASQYVRRERAAKILERLNKFHNYYLDVLAFVEKETAELEFEHSGLIEAKVQKHPVEELLQETDKRILSLTAILDSQDPQGFARQLAALEAEQTTLQAALDAPNQGYQRYLTELSNWEKRRKQILGSQDTPDSLLYYKHQIELAQRYPEELESLYSERRITATRIYQEVTKRANVYREYYGPVLDFIEREQKNKSQLAFNAFRVSFEVIIDSSPFAERFLGHINHGVGGSFCGVDESRKRLDDMLQEGIFGKETSAIDIIEDIMGALKEDRRAPSKRSTGHPIERQLKKNVSIEGLYNFLYEMEYLEPRYALRVGNKGLQELSPGERGLLLLVFYLLIDKGSSPLIIDQPEENLDNQSIKNVLVPCMKAAKERRQLFVITHNPNIAVVCDSEQVIFTSIDKTNGHEVRYDSGSLEDGIISRHIVDVLEGTRPAFENRSFKYKTGGAI
ncbi:MAG: hypothetical protein U1A78_25810 [Polyangia bacterium]